MTPLLAALSRALAAARCSSVAFSASPASTASRKRRTAVRTDERTDLLRCRRFSFVLTRLIWDLMLATRMPRVLPAAELLDGLSLPGDVGSEWCCPAGLSAIDVISGGRSVRTGRAGNPAGAAVGAYATHLLRALRAAAEP